jgi:lipopolysaccharide export system protein LptA
MPVPLLPAWLLILPLVGGIATAAAQPLDLTQGGPITVTARDGLEWHQAEQEVIALGDARAVRQNVTVTADRLIAYYRKKATPGAAAAGAGSDGATPGAATTQPSPPGTTAVQPVAAQSGIAGDTDTAGTEIYRLRAEGHVQIFTATDHAQGDLAVYDIDQAVLVMTGHDLRLTTPNDVLTSRDTMEYWPQKHMAVARGNAVVVTRDARRVAADVLVAYTADTSAPAGAAGAKQAAAPARTRPPPTTAGGAPPAGSDDLATSGKLEKVEAFGHVSVRTPTDTATGDRAVYVPDSGIARLAGDVRITRGQNQLDGQQGEVNMKTGIARLLRGNDARVTGLMVPNDATNRALSGAEPPTPAANPSAADSPGNPSGNPSRNPTGNPAGKPAGKSTGGPL